MEYISWSPWFDASTSLWVVAVIRWGKDAGKVLEGHLYPVTPRAFLARLVTPHHKHSSSPWRSQHGHHASITHLLADRESNGRIRRRAATHHAPRRVSSLQRPTGAISFLTHSY